MGPKTTERRDGLRLRLRDALRPPKGDDRTVTESLTEMSAIREECKEHGINYNELLAEVCKELSVKRGSGRK